MSKYSKFKRINELVQASLICFLFNPFCVGLSPPNNTSGFILALYKNGSDYQHLMRDQYEVNFNQMPSGGTIVYLNGSTDNVEVYINSSTSASTDDVADRTWFCGSFVRSA